MSGFINDNAELLRVLFAVACTLGIYSILYKENKLYRFFEHLFIGLAAGWAIKMAWMDVLKPLWWDRMLDEGRWWWFFAFPVGLLLYAIYSRKHNWMARISLGVLMGFNAGQQFQQFAGLYYKQINTTFKPLVPQGEPGSINASWSGAINNWIFMIILVCVMTYFFFSFEHGSKVIRKTANAGRWFLMVAFGAIFGSTIMARMALFINRVDFLVHDAPKTISTRFRGQ